MTRYAFKILILTLLISLVGIGTIYSSAFQRGQLGLNSIFVRQIIWVAIGLLGLFVAYKCDYRKLWDLAYLLYGLTVFLLLMVLVVGATRLGAQRWIKILWFNFQPSELAKITMVIFLAKYFSRKSVSAIGVGTSRLGFLKGLIIPLAFIALPMGMILIQPDLGTSLMVLFIFVSMLFLADARIKQVLVLLLTGIASLPIGWHILKDYQKERLLVFMNPNIDPLGAGYTIIQSKIAIGSGGLFGKGWLSGTQSQLRFLPESHTDFIFATFTEEWGFVGGVGLIFLYFLLIHYCIKVAVKASDNFAKLLALGIASMFVVQIFVNIAMTMGFAPVVGLPLILMSYGGSSMLISYISIGILMSIDKKRTIF